MDEPPVTAQAETPQPRGPRSFIASVERVECPTCEAVIPHQQINRTTAEHPTLHTLQQTLTIHCEHCGDTHKGVYVLTNGQWQVENVEKV